MLKSLEMFGFKSFADRTRFDFSTGITCVVGPNGSGKSNVVDAIKWVLGDQSPKSLRGKEMTDVIFNGASGRKPSAFAEVALTFNNAARNFALDAAEVQIGRRLWQNGDSEYLINQQPARLKDIKDLFLGTGAGTSAYSIIEQGRVDQILQSNAAARRQVFEEAAGVSRYKARREEATRKLERVDQNLLRLRDIVDEVESQLNSIRSQASKAAKYRELSVELRDWWFGLAADDHRHFSAQLATVEQELAGGEAQLTDLTTRQQDLEQRLAVFDGEIAEVDTRLRTAEHHAAGNRESVVRQEATLRHLNARQRELETDLGRLRGQRTTMQSRSREMIVELRRHEEQLTHSESEHPRLCNELAQTECELAELTSRIKADQTQLDRERQKQVELTQQLSSTQQRADGVRSQREAAQSAVVSTSQRLAQCDADIIASQSEFLRRQAAVDAVLAAVAMLDDRVREARDRQKQLTADQERLQQQLREQREDRSAKLSQQAVLEDLERRQEGLGIGVKEILNRAMTSDYPPWNSILGSVADLIEADLDEAAILEVALGTRAQLIVVRELQPIIDYLNSGTSRLSGRVGFLDVTLPTVLFPLPWGEGRGEGVETIDAATRYGCENNSPNMANVDQCQTSTASLTLTLSQGESGPIQVAQRPVPDLSTHHGVIKRADQLVSLRCQLPGLAEALLSTTWVVSTLTVALDLARGQGQGCRFVTLQGELLEDDGTLLAGAVRSEVALLSRRSELRRLKNDLLRSDRTIVDGERQLADVTQSLKSVERQLESASSDKQEIADRIAQSRSDVATQRQEIERMHKERDAILAETARFESLAAELVLQMDQAQREQAWFEDHLHSLRESTAAFEAELTQRDQQRQTLTQCQVEGRLQLAKHEERLQGLRAASARMQDEQRQRDEQLEEAERRFAAAYTQSRQINLQLLNTNAELWELQLLDEQFAAKVTSVLADKEQLWLRKSTLSEDETRVRQERRELSDRLHAREIVARDARHQLQVCAERIEEEYQLSLDEVVLSGASAFAKWQAEGRSQRSEVKGQVLDNDADADDTVGFVTQSDPDATQFPLPRIGGEGQGERVGPSSILEDSPLAPTLSPDAGEREKFSRHAKVPNDCSTEMVAPDTSFLDIRPELEQRVNRLRRKLKLMGSVNTDSLKDLDELDARFQHLHSQLQDLDEAKATLEEIIRKVNSESRRLFLETFEAVRTHFQQLFRKLFGGGEGDVILEDSEDVLDCGIDIVARPPGKELRSITLLSGGEKSLTAVALLMAIFRSKPSPFCILDEVDAALDEANVERYSGLVKDFKQTTQFIMITHSKRSMQVGDILYGVTMEQLGVSKRMSVRFEDVSDNGDFRVSPASGSNAA